MRQMIVLGIAVENWCLDRFEDGAGDEHRERGVVELGHGTRSIPPEMNSGGTVSISGFGCAVGERVPEAELGDERDDPHLALTLWAHRRVHLVDSLDELRPILVESAGVGAAIPVSSGGGDHEEHAGGGAAGPPALSS